MREISRNAKNIGGQPMFKLKDKISELEAAGKQVIHLEIGDPDFNTPDVIVEAAKRALDDGETHYTSSWGLPDFVASIVEATKASRGFSPSQNQVLVTPGANIAVFYAIFCLVNPGDEVLTPDPGFPTYESTIRMCGAEPRYYHLQEGHSFFVRAEDIEPHITEKTRLLIVNSPQNPTGAATPESNLRAVFDLARERDLYVFTDEIYSRMIYEKEAFFSISQLDGCQERVILSNGFSKAFAMTGWRLGSIIAPVQVTERMMLLLQTTSSCVPPFIQRAGIAAIKGDQTQTTEMMDEYKRRRDFLVAGLNSIEGINCHLPGGAFYAFPNISSFGLSSEVFADVLLREEGVALLPGSNFGDQGEGFVRLCYAASMSDIAEALSRIERLCAQLRVG